MQFPKSRGMGVVLLILFCLMGGPVLVLGLPAVGWMYLLPPLERQYLGADVVSSLNEQSSRHLTSVRWVSKTAPGGDQ